MNKRGYKRGRRWAKPLDQSTAAQAFRQPGIDPRQWVSIGLVTAGGQDDDIVVFDEDEGQVLVRVLLEPTKVQVFARVGAQVAGNGEAEYFPFVEGDEVVVVIPEGDERAGAVIISRLNNGIDKFPMQSVAGQDPTTNSFAFRRTRTPFVDERAGPILLRSALTGAMFSIDSSGVITLRDGESSAFQMSPDVIGIQGPSSDDSPPEFLMQLNLTDRQFSLQVGDAVLNLSASDATPSAINLLQVPNNLALSAGGNASSEHLMTTEAFWHCLQHAMNVIAGAVSGQGALTGPGLAGVLNLLGTSGIFPAAIATAAITPMVPTVAAPINTGFAAMPQKLPSTTQLSPGLGSATINVG
jgi:hypothetical protein